MQNLKTIISVVVVILIIGGLWWGVGIKRQTNSTANVSFVGDETYQDAVAKFNFKYPKGYAVKEIGAPSEGEARTILLSKDGKGASVQIAVSPFDEDIVLTTERIKSDVPELVMKNVEEISIGTLTKGVKFESDAGVNVWFVARGNLFQLTAFLDEVSTLNEIISSLNFSQ